MREALIILLAPLIAALILIVPWLLDDRRQARKCRSDVARRNDALKKISAGSGTRKL